MPKFGMKVPHIKCDSHTSFKVKRSKRDERVTDGRGHIVSAELGGHTACYLENVVVFTCRCTLSEIYTTIMSAFPYYRRQDIRRRWQNSIRHSLSFNDCFVRVPARAGRHGGGADRGAAWTLHPDARDMFAEGCFLRRPQRFRCRRSKVVDVAASATMKHGRASSKRNDLEESKKLNCDCVHHCMGP